MRRHKKEFSFLKRVPAQYIIATAMLLLVALGAVYFYQKADLPSSWCLPFETLDWQGQYCYATCNDDASCSGLDESYKIIHDSFSDEDRRWYYNFSTIPIEIPENGFLPSSAAEYTIHSVVNGKLGEIIEASSTPRYRGYSQPTWDLISLVLPLIAARRVTEFAGYSDVAGDAGAFVMAIDESSRTWSMAVNYAGFYSPRGALYDRGQSIHTLIHEIGHVVTLGDAFNPASYLFDFEGKANTRRPLCYTTQFLEGCAKAGSRLAVFAARFWPEAEGDGETSAEYTPEKFVSSYATTNIAEDITESWSAFVLLDKPKDATIADKKILFFYQYPELMQARAEILKNIHRLH